MADEKRIRLLIAEPHPLLRDALNIYFSEQVEIKVVGRAADTAQTLPLVEELRPDVVLVSSTLRPMDILTFITCLRDESPESKIVMLSSNFDPIPVKNYLEAGATRAVVKGIFASDLLTIIQRTHTNT